MWGETTAEETTEPVALRLRRAIVLPLSLDRDVARAAQPGGPRVTKIGEEDEVHEDVPEPVPVPEEGDLIPEELEPVPETAEPAPHDS